jgi:hypothetical protein
MVQRTFEQTPTKTESALPRLVRFGGTVKNLDGSPPAGVVGITFALYSDQTGGAPLWLETQNVSADSKGHYNVLLGSAKPEGLPAELFTSEQAHWVGVQVEGQPEQPRVLLVSAPYALKAGDAETIGGLPPSAFVLAAPPAGAAAPASASPSLAARTDLAPAVAADVTTTGGTANYLPFFTGASTVLDSAVYQLGTGSTAKVGINTSAPTATLDVVGSGIIQGRLSLPPIGAATAGAGVNSEPFDLFASAFNSGTSTAVLQMFQIQAEPVGNDTATPGGALSLLYGSGGGAATETGLKIASNGVITFAGGQTFPNTGDGTVTSVGSGAGLTGGPITSAGLLSIATGGVSNAMLANPSLTVLAGTDLTGGGSVALGGSATLNVDTTRIPQLGAANTFNGNQTVNGNVGATSVSLSGTNGSFSLGNGNWLSTSAVPYVRPNTTNTYGIFDVLANGIGAGAWIDVGSDYTESPNGLYLMLGMFPNCCGFVMSKGLGSDAGLPLVLQPAPTNPSGGGNVSGMIGFNTMTPAFQYHAEFDQNSETAFIVANASTGTAAYADVGASNETGVNNGRFILRTLGTGYTTIGGLMQNSGELEAGPDLAGGMSIVTRNSAGQIRFYPGGYINEALVLFPSLGAAVGNNPADPGAENLSVAGTIQGGGYKSSDGTAGFTGTCAPGTTITVKNGLITGCS